MKKIFSIITLFLIILLQAGLSASAENKNVFLPKNTLIPVNPAKTLSTSVYEEGDTVYFIVPSDMWIEEYKIIPKNSIIKTNITMLKMPVVGINAAMKLEAGEIKFPDGTTQEIKGDISYKGEKQIGGNLTPPLSYNKSLHRWDGEYYTGVISQYVPSGEYEFGQHITIMPSEVLYLILTEDFTRY